MSNAKAVIIADDLTGCLDSIAPFAERSCSCIAAVSLDALHAAVDRGPEVIGVNLGTRELPPDQAFERAFAATRLLAKVAGSQTVWIKKIDSRMKGHIAQEIAAVSRILEPDAVLLCPAIPDLGRIVAQGKLLGFGVATAIDVAEAAGLGLPCDVPDATSQTDLERVAQRWRPGILVAAARGLAAALACRIYQDSKTTEARVKPGPIGFAIGSRDPVTLAQIAELPLDTRLGYVAAPDGQVPDFSATGDFIIQATQGTGAAGNTVSQRLAEGALRHADGLATLVLSGGETAAEVLRAAGIGLLQVEGEVLPGLPLCHPLDRPGFPDLITKSGGFGPPDTLSRLWQAAQVRAGVQ